MLVTAEWLEGDLEVRILDELASGDTKPGLEAAREPLAFFESQLAARLGGPPPPPPPPAANAPIRHRVITTVPENWIAFIPVHVDGSNREIQLQRAALERTRWTDGRVYLWLRVQRQTGRGEGSSGLALDQLIDVPFAPPKTS